MAAAVLPGSAAAAGAVQGGEVIERVVASVDGRPVLLSDVRTLAQLRGLSEDAARDALIDEMLMLHEATRLPQVVLLPEEEERAVQALLADNAAAAELPAAAVRRVARRQALILRYVELRFEPLVRVSDAELRAEYERRHADATAAPPPYEEEAPRIEADLVRAALDRRVEEWVASLREEGDVVYVAAGGS